MKTIASQEIIEILKDYFGKRDDVAMAFLFGSSASGGTRDEGDIDVAVYFKNKGFLDMESAVNPPTESVVWSDIERLFHRDVDLIVLNRAPAYLCDSAVRNGIPIIIKDQGLFLRYLLWVTEEAEVYRSNIKDMWKARYGTA